VSLRLISSFDALSLTDGLDSGRKIAGKQGKGKGNIALFFFQSLLSFRAGTVSCKYEDSR
jgi:hypothetical protein